MSPSSPSDPIYAVEIVFHSGRSLPIADINNLLCDPYVLATIKLPDTYIEKHDLLIDDEDERSDYPPIQCRTPTCRRSRNPTWNHHWMVAGLPSSGCELVMRIRDEDPGDRDDRLGKASFVFEPGQLKEGFEVKMAECKIKKRKGSFRPWIQTYLASVLPGQKLEDMKHSRVIISIKVIGKVPNQDDRRVYTMGPNTYSRHFSPLIGSFVGIGKGAKNDDKNEDTTKKASSFTANKLQLTGPVPPELHHHFVGYRPIINTIFNRTGLVGHLLNHGLRKQYRIIYSYDKQTQYGIVEGADEDIANHEIQNSSPADAPSGSQIAGIHSQNALDSSGQTRPEPVTFAKQFLEMADWGRGGKLFTYVILLDGEWRFCETGDEFAIDLLSKHSMHAEGAKVIAFSGEFFVRRISPSHETKGEERNGEDRETEEESRDPRSYELIIDNDSGTYRPKKELLPKFQSWLEDPHRLGCLGRVTAMHCFDEALEKMKKDRKEEKKQRVRGGEIPKKAMTVKRSGSSVSSLSGMGSVNRLGRTGSMSSGEVEQVLEQHQVENEHQEQSNDGKKLAAEDGAERNEANGVGEDDQDNSKSQAGKKHSHTPNVSIADSGINV